MEWYNILILIFGSGGLISSIIAIYQSKSQKSNIDAETFKKFFDESQERYNEELERNRLEIELAKKEREEAKKSSEIYRKTNDEKVMNLEKTMHQMELRMNIKMRSINSAFRCTRITDMKECPVIKTYDNECEKAGICETNF